MVTNFEIQDPDNKLSQKLYINKVIADKEQELEFLWLEFGHEPDIKQVENGSWRNN